MVDLEGADSNEPWNVAKGFSFSEILEPLQENRRLIIIAVHGCDDINNSSIITPESKTYHRVEAIKRIHTNLKNMHDGTKDFIKSEDKNNYKIILDTLYKIKVALKTPDHISRIITDQRTHTIKQEIIEENFDKILEGLCDINSDLKGILKRANLIFPPSEEVNIGKFKEQMINGG